MYLASYKLAVICMTSAMFSQHHPVILYGKHPLTKLIIWSEHLHAGPMLVSSSSLNRCYDIMANAKLFDHGTAACRAGYSKNHFRESILEPTLVKACVCVCCHFVKAVYLELVSDLTSTAFIVCLRRFLS